MEILHFNRLHYWRTIAKFTGFSLVLFPKKYFFNLYSLTLLLPFLSNQLGDTKTIGPFALKGYGSIALAGYRTTLLIIYYK